MIFDPDGRRLFVGSEREGVKIWDLETGKIAQEQVDDSLRNMKAVISVTINSDSTFLAWGGSDEDEDATRYVTLWDLKQNRLAAKLECHVEDVYTVAFNTARTCLAAGCSDGTIWTWDVTDPYNPIRHAMPLLGHSSIVWRIAFSPNDRLLASASQDSSVILWDASTMQRVGMRLQGHADAVNSLVFSPDGSLLASGGDDKSIFLWDIRVCQPISGHSGIIYQVAASADGRWWASCDYKRDVLVWESRGQTLARRLPVPDTFPVCMAFKPGTNLLAVGTRYGEVLIWDLDADSELPNLRFETGETKNRSSLLFSIAYDPVSGLLATGNIDGDLCMWNAETGKLVAKAAGAHKGYLYSLAFSDDLLASCGDDGLVCLWDVSTVREAALASSDRSEVTLEVTATLSGHRQAVRSLSFHPATRHILVSGSEDRTIRAWDVRYPQMESIVLARHESAVMSVQFNPDGSLLASGSRDGTVALWMVPETLTFTHPDPGPRLNGVRLRAHQSTVNSVQFTADGRRLLSGAEDRTLLLWDYSPEGWKERACQVANRDLTEEEWTYYVSTERPPERTCP